MTHYLANYWSLYREFLEVFKNFKYRDIPIALLTNFYQHIDSNLKQKMENENFHTSLLNPEIEQAMIQPYFEGVLEKIRVPFMKESIDGKTLINMDYTRLPEITFRTWFDPSQTIILSRSKTAHLHGIPNESILKYEVINNKVSETLIKSAKYVFNKHQNHPAFGNEFFQNTFLTRIPLMVKTINAVYNLLDHLPISTIVVGTTEDMLSRTLAIVGSMRGIKSICLQHGILMGEEAFMPVFTTLIGAYGEYEKRWYVQRGLEMDRIAEIGHPKYDQIFTSSRTDSKEVITKLGLSSDKETLLIITGPQIDFIKFEKLMKNLSDNPRFQIIIKPHPWEIGKGRFKIYTGLEKKYPSIKVYTSRENILYELIPAVDGVVSTLSTVVLESILFNKPVFIYNFMNSNRAYDYFDSLGEYIQTDPNRLTEVISAYFSSDEHQKLYAHIRREYLSKSYNDGSSGEKLAHVIKNFNQ
ncbi:CDP-glycerol glycerophosphotransferase family protein [Bacillus sp. ISL-18]|uniref:CDP-glycerol glycerophosphotransferase family protein n=1 Tax=Bacillus sp. ISL-18 TaxID=2819118 RepID=UPI001BE9BE9F|nr:CDP-glycerol glycerophosphotransferase family protein [Bacillus sp. ISL-18]MBT2658750.1 CDP-glycerol glycerophosphotransferase family protein [Bacillus sp. ISL-18]